MALKTTVWTGKAGGTAWATAGNWSLGVPAAGQAVRFADGGTWTISLAPALDGSTATAGSLTVAGDALTFTSGALALVAPPPRQGLAYDLSILSGSVRVAASATLTAETAILNLGTLGIAGSVTTKVLSSTVGTTTLAGSAARLAASDLVLVGTTLSVTRGATLSDGGSGYGQLFVGSGAAAGPGTVTVSGTASSINIQQIYLGNGYSGHLDVRRGATVTTSLVNLGQNGDGYLTIGGGGATVSAETLVVGGIVPVSSTVSVTAGGSLALGAGGLLIRNGTLALTPLAHVTIAGGTNSEGGRILATGLARGPMRETSLDGSLYLGTNPFDGGATTYLSATGRTWLQIDGAISGDANGIFQGTLQVGTGRVVLGHANNTHAHNTIYGGILELAAPGAGGTGDIAFIDGNPSLATLRVDDAAGALANTILNFGANDAIDLRDFGFGAGIAKSFANNTLTLTSATETAALHIVGTYTAADFLLRPDGAGGTVITAAHG